MKLLIFDTETTGLPKSREPAIKAPGNWPHIVSFAWTLVDTDGFKILSSEYHIVKPQWNIPEDSVKIHGITQEKALNEGIPLSSVILKFLEVDHDKLIAHNINFDYNVLVNAVLWDLKLKIPPDFKPMYCSMELMKPVMKLQYANGRGYKPPKLSELYEYVLHKKPEGMHNAQVDTQLLVEIIQNCPLLQRMIGLTTDDNIQTNASKKARTTIYL
jgi:DNA polymerase III epsilon subunit-like protein